MAFSEKSLAPGKVSRPHSGRKRQPGNRLELVVNEKCGEAAVGIFDITERRAAAAVVENRSELLMVLLVEGVNACLKIIPCQVRAEAGLASRIS